MIATERHFHELLSVVRGDKLGEGVARKVYAVLLNDSLVIKVESASRSFQNVAEWEVWDWVKSDTSLARWFAPCRNISACGLYLIQDRCEPIRDSERPKTLPAFLCDLKRENFGLLNGKVVCCDYGMILSMVRYWSRKQIKANWK